MKRKYSYMTTRTTKIPQIGDIWLVHFPYITPGNMEKVRPAIIRAFEDDDKTVVQKLTTRCKKGNKVFNHPKLNKKSYLSKDIVTVSDYNLIRKIGRIEERESEKYERNYNNC